MVSKYFLCKPLAGSDALVQKYSSCPLLLKESSKRTPVDSKYICGNIYFLIFHYYNKTQYSLFGKNGQYIKKRLNTKVFN